MFDVLNHNLLTKVQKGLDWKHINVGVGVDMITFDVRNPVQTTILDRHC